MSFDATNFMRGRPPRVLVVGVAVLDYVHRMGALPAGGHKHRSHSFEVIGGGVGANAAIAVSRLGADVSFVTRLGADRAGDELAEMLGEQGLHLMASRGGRQPLSSVMIDDAGERMIVNFPGADLSEWTPVLPEFDAVLTDCRWPAAAELALRAAKAAGKPAVIDGERFVPPELAALASHVVFSVLGLRDYTGEQDLDKGLAKVNAELPGNVAYTDGARGVIWGSGATVAPPQVDAVDTLGAGDVWHGAFTLAQARGLALVEASEYANEVAALKCTRAGGWDVYPTEQELV